MFIFIILLFSLEQLESENQILNTKCQFKCFVAVTVWKVKNSLVFTFFEMPWQQNFVWHLGFSILVLVTSWSNENNIKIKIHLLSNLFNIFPLIMRHVSQIGEYDKTRKKAGKTIDTRCHQTVSVMEKANN